MTGGASISATTRRARLSWVSRGTVPPWISSCVVAYANSEFAGKRPLAYHTYRLARSTIMTALLYESRAEMVSRGVSLGITRVLLYWARSTFAVGEIPMFVFRLLKQEAVSDVTIVTGILGLSTRRYRPFAHGDKIGRLLPNNVGNILSDRHLHAAVGTDNAARSPPTLC